MTGSADSNEISNRSNQNARKLDGALDRAVSMTGALISERGSQLMRACLSSKHKTLILILQPE